MSLLRTVGRFLVGTLGFLVVAWPAAGNLALSALGVSFFAFPAVDQAWVESHLTLSRRLAVSATVVLALAFGGFFAARSYSLKRFAVFVLVAYPLALVLGLGSQFVLRNLVGAFLGDLSQPLETTITATYSFLTFLGGTITSYYVAYGAWYDRLVDR